MSHRISQRLGSDPIDLKRMMPLSTFERLVADARALFDAGLGAVDAGEALRRNLRLEGNTLEAGGARYALGGGGRTLVLGGGKAAAAMGMSSVTVVTSETISYSFWFNILWRARALSLPVLQEKTAFFFIYTD